MDLAGKRVLITGASGGIGRALAEAFAAAGAELVLTDLEPPAPVSDGDRCLALDVTDDDAWTALAAELGHLDVLVHNAGVTVHGPFQDQQAADLAWLLDVDLRAPLLGTHALLPLLLASKGHLVLVSSLAALFPVPLQATYGAAKAALRSLGAALRIELAPKGVGVTTVMPGNIATGFLDGARASDDAERAWMADQMRRTGTRPEAVGQAVVRAVQRNRAEITVGLDAAAVRFVTRWMPGLLHGLLHLGWRLTKGRP